MPTIKRFWNYSFTRLELVSTFTAFIFTWVTTGVLSLAQPITERMSIGDVFRSTNDMTHFLALVSAVHHIIARFHTKSLSEFEILRSLCLHDCSVTLALYCDHIYDCFLLFESIEYSIPDVLDVEQVFILALLDFLVRVPKALFVTKNKEPIFGSRKCNAHSISYL